MRVSRPQVRRIRCRMEFAIIIGILISEIVYEMKLDILFLDVLLKVDGDRYGRELKEKRAK